MTYPRSFYVGISRQFERLAILHDIIQLESDYPVIGMAPLWRLYKQSNVPQDMAKALLRGIFPQFCPAMKRNLARSDSISE